MPIVIPSVAEIIDLNYMVGKTATAEPLTLRLFTNNVTPTKAFTLASLTEASGNGYAALALTGASWTVATGRSGADGVGNATTTFTSATAAFVAGDVGRIIQIEVSGVIHLPIINSVTNGTTVVLSFAIPTGSSLVWRISSAATYAQQTFTFTGALGNVYGYYLNRTTGTDLMVAERFSDGPYNITANGDQIKVTPLISLS